MDNNRSPIKNGRALIWLIVLVAGVLIGCWLFAQAVAVGPIQEPPWTAVAIVVVAAIALLVSKAEAADDDATVAVDGEPSSQLWQRVGQLVAPLRRNGRAFTLLLALILIAYVLNRIPALGLPANSGATSCHCFSVSFISALDHIWRSVSIPAEKRSYFSNFSL
jgi:hypothetical protein